MEYVFCDLDETLIECKTMLENLKYYFISTSKTEEIGIQKYDFIECELLEYANKTNVDRGDMNLYFYSKFKGILVEDLRQSCQEWFEKIGKHYLSKKVVEELRKHQVMNRKICIVSGSFEQCIAPIAEYLKIDDFLCARLEIHDGFYTGEINGPTIIGAGKASAILNYKESVGDVDLDQSFAYGDDISDLPMLLTVGNPIVINHCPQLRCFAEKNSWVVI